MGYMDEIAQLAEPRRSEALRILQQLQSAFEAYRFDQGVVDRLANQLEHLLYG
jgi:hypothetical protein